MSIFRSELMGYYNLSMPRENAWEVLNTVGSAGCVQFVDQNPKEAAFQRPYAQQIRRAEDIEQQLQMIQNLLDRFEKVTGQCPDVDQYLINLSKYLPTREKSEKSFFDEVEVDVNDRFKKIEEQVKFYDEHRLKQQKLLYYRAVLIKTKEIMQESTYYSMVNDSHDNELQDIEKGERIGLVNQKNQQSSLCYLAGVIDKKDTLRFSRIVHRASRGNSWLQFREMEDDDVQKQTEHSDDVLQKTVFLIIYQTGFSNQLQGKLNRVCDSFSASRFQLPQNSQAHDMINLDIKAQLSETHNLVELTKIGIEKMLEYFIDAKFSDGNCSCIEELRLFVLKEKTIYHNMNLLLQKNSSYVGYCWIPTADWDKINNSLNLLRKDRPDIASIELREHQAPKSKQPPTYFKTNKFTWAFQEIVNTYGIARYREVNPGYFAVVFFPFLFGVMFGDIGHGGMLLIFGIYLCLCNDSLKNSSLAVLCQARYLLLLMGIFAFYSGFVYNDFFSLPMDFQGGSCYINVEGEKEAERIEGCTYPFGFDPKWYVASNELNYFNSFKMKLAVIIGVAQMMFGIFQKGVNAIYFRQPLDFFFEFLPQVIFMCVTFGYMDILIFMKWGINWEEPGRGTDKAPSIIGVLINLPLALGSTKGTPMYDTETQESLQFSFLIIALLMVPIMLLVKPLILKCTMPAHEEHKPVEQGLLKEHELQEKKDHADDDDEHEEHDFSEIFVHQIIETIEFVLGSISNTASYLRLWALSLAHGQLAKVFFEKTIGGGIETGSFLAVFIGYALWINITFAVIMAMDCMECFLHALRLQWVEFQNKFYKADGHKFNPFSFKDALTSED